MSTSTKLTYEDFKHQLECHIGSMEYYRLNPFVPIVVTEGIKDFADTCECYWLFDLILLNTFRLHKQYGTLFVTVKVNKRGTCHITVNEDEGMPILFSKKQRDLCQLIPSGEYMFFLINDTLLLPSEY